MSKGSSKAAQDQVGVDSGFATGSANRGTGDRSTILPFLTNEINNPTGYDPQTLSAMQTQGGQAVAGSVGQSGEAASLLGSRTGNTAATPGIIDSTARAGMSQQSNNALSILANNAQLKQKQQQAGAEGMEGLYQTDTGNALKALGLSTDSINAWTKANEGTQSAEQGWGKLGIDAGQDAFGDYNKVNNPGGGK